jgi:hypothetical protein
MNQEKPGYEALPIFRAATALAVMMERTVRGFSRFHKYTMGPRLRGALTSSAASIRWHWRGRWRREGVRRRRDR